jgi:Cd2+/Zn2+-exporting ATPase
MDVVKIESFNGQSSDGLLQIAASLEQSSEHPLAAAIVSSAKQRGLSLGETRSITTQRGLGVHGIIDGEEYFIGRAKFFSDSRIRLTQADAMRLISPPQDTALNSAGSVAAQTAATTTVWLGTAQRLIGTIHLSDHPRPEARQTLVELRQLGVQRFVMLTGDNPLAARAVAREIGIDEIEADLLPQDKIDKVRAFSSTGRVAMVGDGVNDAPALAAADIGIALGGQSSDTALETADVVVMAASLAKIPELIRLGRRCRQLLRQNIGFALASKLAVLVLAVIGVASMWMAIAADVGASMIVIANGMRTIDRRASSIAENVTTTSSTSIC